MKKIVLILLIQLMFFYQVKPTSSKLPQTNMPRQETIIGEESGENRDAPQLSRNEVLKKQNKQLQKEDTALKSSDEHPDRQKVTNVSRQAERNKALIFEATAYCSCAKCCGKSDGITKSGVKVHPGTLAVDPQVIPMGSKVYIEGMGWFVAEDTGNFRGNRIDIYMETHEEALQFGRKKVKVLW